MDYSRDTKNSQQRTIDPLRTVKESILDGNSLAQVNNYLANGALGQTGRGILSSRDQQDMTLFKSKMAARLAAGGADRDGNGALSPQAVSDYAYSGANAIGTKEYVVANAMGLRPYKPSETP